MKKVLQVWVQQATILFRDIKKNFKRGVPGNLSEKEKNELFFDVRKGMGLSISLAADFEPQNSKVKTLQEF